jgi:hypothetical protein
MQNSLPSTSSRKKFLLWAAAAVGSAAVYKFNTKKKEIANPEHADMPMCQSKTVKMLTQDGTLVEIDRDLLASSGQKITNTELQNWIKK